MTSGDPTSIEGGRAFLTARDRKKEREGGEETTGWKRTFLRCRASPPSDPEDGTELEVSRFSYISAVLSLLC